jgi:hypothetical protein
MNDYGDCPNCGAQDVKLFWLDCCLKWMCEDCKDRHDDRCTTTVRENGIA